MKDRTIIIVSVMMLIAFFMYLRHDENSRLYSREEVMIKNGYIYVCKKASKILTVAPQIRRRQ